MGQGSPPRFAPFASRSTEQPEKEASEPCGGLPSIVGPPLHRLPRWGGPGGRPNGPLGGTSRSSGRAAPGCPPPRSCRWSAPRSPRPPPRGTSCTCCGRCGGQDGRGGGWFPACAAPATGCSGTVAPGDGGQCVENGRLRMACSLTALLFFTPQAAPFTHTQNPQPTKVGNIGIISENFGIQAPHLFICASFCYLSGS